MTSLHDLYSPRLPQFSSTLTDQGLHSWAKATTHAINALPNFSTFSLATPEGEVAAQAPALGFNYAPSSAASTLWLKKSGSTTLGWIALA